MSLSISTASPAIARPPFHTAEGAKRFSPKQVNTNRTGPDNRVAQETSALNRVLGGYRADLGEGAPTAALASLARQIAADARLVGQIVPPRASAAVATPVAEVGSAQANNVHFTTLL